MKDAPVDDGPETEEVAGTELSDCDGDWPTSSLGFSYELWRRNQQWDKDHA